MTKTVVIRQPDFLSYPGFFQRFLSADLYVALDHVQFVDGTSKSWTHRDKIKTRHGVQWLTISVRHAPRDTPICDIELSDTDWRTRNLNLLRDSYGSARFFDQVWPEVTALYELPHRMLADFTLASIELLFELLDISVPVIRSSVLHPVGAKNEMLVDILRKVDATHYLSGVQARDYFDPAPYAGAGIEVQWQDYHASVYPQLHGEFVSGLSTIDLLFNCGVDGSRQILRTC